MSAFISFITNRTRPVANEGGRELSMRESYDLIGVFGGDDAICASPVDWVPLARVLRVAKKFNMTMKVNIPKFVSFLGRIYGGLYHYDLNSCSDPARVFSKLHTCPKNSIPLEKLVEKAMALQLTDKFTPIIGEWSAKVLSFSKPTYVDKLLLKLKISTGLSSGLYHLLHSDQVSNFQTETSDWMEEYWGSFLELHGFNLANFEEYMVTSETLDQMLVKQPFGAHVVDFEDVVEIEPRRSTVTPTVLNKKVNCGKTVAAIVLEDDIKSTKLARKSKKRYYKKKISFSVLDMTLNCHCAPLALGAQYCLNKR